jgi:hypothetical protein
LPVRRECQTTHIIPSDAWAIEGCQSSLSFHVNLILGDHVIAWTGGISVKAMIIINKEAIRINFSLYTSANLGLLFQ